MIWKLLYQDIFDRKTPIAIQKEWKNLEEGLFYLWQYTLSEWIDENGSPSFSKFLLSYGDTYGRNIDLSYKEQLVTLRKFVYGEQIIIHDKNSYDSDGEAVLKSVAKFQFGLIVKWKVFDDSCLELFDILGRSRSKSDFLSIIDVI